MIHRRLYALPTSLFMFHLMLVGNDFVCATHGTDHDHGHGTASVHRAATSDMPRMTDMPHTTRSVLHDPTTDTEPPCETPVQADCCQAMTSCSASISLGVEAAAVEAPSHDVAAPEGVSTAPVSLVVGPEPPPPKD